MLEKHLDVEKLMRHELEKALKLMENELIEKQEQIKALRDQLVQVKQLNIDTLSNCAVSWFEILKIILTFLIKNAEESLKSKLNELDIANRKIKELDRNVSSLENQYQALVSSKENLEKEFERSKEKNILNEVKL